MIQQLLTLLLLSTSILFADTLLEVELEHNTTSTDPLEVIIKLTNVSEDTIKYDIASLATKDGLIRSGVFTLSEDNQSIPYKGALVLFKDVAYDSIPSGETHTFTVSLSKEYEVHIGTHEYEINFRKSIHIKDDNTSKLVPVSSNSLELIATINPEEKMQVLYSTANTCSSNQRSILLADLNKAKIFASNAKTKLDSGNNQHSIYREWFGTGNYNTVKNNFSRIYSALYQNIQFNCNPTLHCTPTPESTPMAWVYPNTPYNINLCPLYWNYSINTKATTLVHEVSHFRIVANTEDLGIHEYGARSLARTSPHLAIRNSYSYGYYAKYIGTSSGGGGSSTTWTTGAYSNNQDISKTLSVSGASALTITVSGATEANYDFIYIYNASGQLVQKLHGNINTTFTVSGASIRARLTSDHSVTKSGVTVSISSSSGGGGGGGTSNINYEFNSAQGWTYENLRQHGNGPTGGVWYFQASYNDPQLISPALNLNANVLKKVVIQMANDHNPYQYSRLQVYWRGTGQGYSEANSQTVSVTNHGGWSTYTIDMSSNPRWNGNIREIRIDPIYRGDGHWLAFDYIRFTR